MQSLTPEQSAQVEKLIPLAVAIARDLGGDDNAEQEALLCLCRAVASFPARSPSGGLHDLRAYVRTSVRRAVLATLTGRRPEIPVPVVWAEVSPDFFEVELRDIVARLPPHVRPAADLLWVQGMPIDDVAAVLGVNRRTVFRRLAAARRVARRVMGLNEEM